MYIHMQKRNWKYIFMQYYYIISELSLVVFHSTVFGAVREVIYSDIIEILELR